MVISGQPMKIPRRSLVRFARARAAFKARSSSLAARRVEGACLALGLAVGAAALPSGASVMPREAWTPRRVAITFDDGPHPDFTERLLAVLRREDSRATFFMVGRPAEKNPRLVDAVLRRGCEAANHTYAHPNLSKMSGASVLAELEQTRRILDRPGTPSPLLFRPPGGRFDAGVLGTTRVAGYQMALWTVLPRDHENPSADLIRRRVLSEVSDGAVVLLHSGKENTLRALPLILEELRERGYRCVTVSRLLAERRSTDPTALWLDAASLPPRPALPPEDAVEEGP